MVFFSSCLCASAPLREFLGHFDRASPHFNREGGKLNRWLCLAALFEARLPLVEESADVAVGEVEIGQLVAEVDGVGQVAGVGAALGKLEEQFLAGLVL